MSYSIDVNVLLYASSAKSPHHAAAMEFLRQCQTDSTIWYLTWLTLMSFLRMSTHPSILSPPLRPDDAMRSVQSLLDLPQVRLLSEGKGFWDVYLEVTRGSAVRGKEVPDAHLAALLKQHGVVTLYSNDRDFLRYPFLRVRNPLT